MTQTNFHQTLQPHEKEIAVASFGKKLKDYSFDEMIVLMNGLIHKAYLSCGTKIDTKLINQTINELCIDLQKENGFMSFEDVQIAFKNGWKKKYGEYYGLNNATYFIWVNAYSADENRARIKKLIADAKENHNKVEPVKKTEAEIEAFMKTAVLDSFEAFKRGAFITDSGNVKYNYLDKRRLIDFTVARKNKILKIAEERLKAEALEGMRQTQIVKSAMSKIHPETIKSEAKKEALNQYFSQLVELHLELSDLLK